jgi:hypothetical protein
MGIPRTGRSAGHVVFINKCSNARGRGVLETLMQHELSHRCKSRQYRNTSSYHENNDSRNVQPLPFHGALSL